MSKFAPGMRVIIRDEEWMIKKCDPNSFGSYTLQCVGISPLVKDTTEDSHPDFGRKQQAGSHNSGEMPIVRRADQGKKSRFRLGIWKTIAIYACVIGLIHREDDNSCRLKLSETI